MQIATDRITASFALQTAGESLFVVRKWLPVAKVPRIVAEASFVAFEAVADELMPVAEIVAPYLNYYYWWLLAGYQFQRMTMTIAGLFASLAMD